MAVIIKEEIRRREIDIPTAFDASLFSPFPSAMLEYVQHPSPIIVAIAKATIVSGNTTLFAAFP